METKTQLEVGDKIVKTQYGNMQLLVIDRVTAKRAYCGSLELKREIPLPNEFSLSPYITQIGGGMYNSTTYHLYVESVYGDRIKRQNLESVAKEMVGSFVITKATNETLEKLIELLKPQQ